jgi:hypothetical protein
VVASLSPIVAVALVALVVVDVLFVVDVSVVAVAVASVVAVTSEVAVVPSESEPALDEASVPGSVVDVAGDVERVVEASVSEALSPSLLSGVSSTKQPPRERMTTSAARRGRPPRWSGSGRVLTRIVFAGGSRLGRSETR